MTALALNPWLQLIRAQCLNLVREPAYTLPTLLFPVMFYAFFGLLMIPAQAKWLLCTFATFGVVGAALFSFERVDGDIHLEIADDGRGGLKAQGSGVQGMRARIESLGGELEFESSGGTRIVARLPEDTLAP